MDIANAVLKEPDIESVREYAQRVTWLNIIFFSMFFISAVGMAVLLVHVKPFVVLAQRSNVETLTLAFLLIFYLYLMLISARGAWGALRNLGFRLFGSEESKQHCLEAKHPPEPITVALNLAVEGDDETLEIPIGDAAGKLGKLRFQGSRLTHLDAVRDGTSSIFPFAVEQINQLHPAKNGEPKLEIVEWSKIDSEETEKYLAIAEFARRLERNLEKGPLWPTIKLTPDDIAHLTAQFSKLCKPLRSEALLPHWEYGGEHKLPIIPEPLGIVSLSRTEKRVDPLASMLSVLITVGVSLALLILMIFYPPWVPGK